MNATEHYQSLSIMSLKCHLQGTTKETPYVPISLTLCFSCFNLNPLARMAFLQSFLIFMRIPGQSAEGAAERGHAFSS